MFHPPLTLTFNNAALTLETGLRAIADGQAEIDLGELAAVDSSAVATLIAWRRAATKRGTCLQFRNVPANLRGLAELYGVSEFL